MPGTPSSSSRAHISLACSMPSRRTASGSSATRSNRSASAGGNGAPDSCTERSMVPIWVTGITPARIGVSQPAAATRSRSRR